MVILAKDIFRSFNDQKSETSIPKEQFLPSFGSYVMSQKRSHGLFLKDFYFLHSKGSLRHRQQRNLKLADVVDMQLDKNVSSWGSGE